jgi:hypothetical protein
MGLLTFNVRTGSLAISSGAFRFICGLHEPSSQTIRPIRCEYAVTVIDDQFVDFVMIVAREPLGNMDGGYETLSSSRGEGVSVRPKMKNQSNTKAEPGNVRSE